MAERTGEYLVARKGDSTAVKTVLTRADSSDHKSADWMAETTGDRWAGRTAEKRAWKMAASTVSNLAGQTGNSKVVCWGDLTAVSTGANWVGLTVCSRAEHSAWRRAAPTVDSRAGT